ncbi:VOC family protein [Aquabacterium sp. A7-Y]|uniref:VOC family protein n=1 Tax=Aquabacterium sp. A7-Y TaxID=1349605 RepID=UPI00223CF3FB|nr:VOC family protein [Aquabacterium sp. A7-Y]MCW7541007.1 VOC family protein [Aquabacterium sp. A7-Y]
MKSTIMTMETLEQPANGSLWTWSFTDARPTKPFARPLVRLKVTDLRRSVAFYEQMFDQCRATVLGEQHATFDVADPPLNLILIQQDGAIGYEGHMGIQFKEMDQVNAIRERFIRAGIEIYVEETEVACCYSVQNKVWVRDPDENSWEFFMVVERNVSEGCGDVCACKGCGDFE